MDPQLAHQILTARHLLSSMPADAFMIYIVPLIRRHGWPFDESGKPFNGVGARLWFQMLDQQNVQTISQLSWERHSFRFSLRLFHPRSRRVITMIIEHHARIAYHAGIESVTNSQKRFLGFQNHLARTGQIPVPVILQRDPLGLRILDGNHRLAAMASFPNPDAGIVDCWLGTLPSL